MMSKIASAKTIISKALDTYNDYAWEIAFSGGKDSSVLLHFPQAGTGRGEKRALVGLRGKGGKAGERG
mgnify:CR=1 FL=1